MKSAQVETVSHGHPRPLARVSETVLVHRRAEVARKCYLAANGLVALGLILAFLPRFDRWIWPVILGISVLITVLGLVIIQKGKRNNGLTALLFAWVVLPIWVFCQPLLRPPPADTFKIAVAERWAEQMAVDEESLLQQSVEPKSTQAEPKEATSDSAPKAVRKPVRFIKPDPQDGSIAEVKEWLRGVLINPDALEFVSWSTEEKGDTITSVVVFNTRNTRNEVVEERLKFVFNRAEPDPHYVYNQKTNRYLYLRPGSAYDTPGRRRQ